MSSSKLPSSAILEMIECEIEGLSLNETSYRYNMSETACFNFRQRLYSMAAAKMEDIQLQEQTELDSTYAKINLAGTKPENMPRISKKRGKQEPVVGEYESLRGLSHHKICITSAIDEYDNILYRIAGLGKESIEKYEQYGEHFTDVKMMISDSDRSIAAFAENHAIDHDPVLSGSHTSLNGNSLGDVNQLHQTLKDLYRQKHGVSTRHLPGYLSWISYLKRLRYTTERKNMCKVVYKDLYETEARLRRDDICRKEQPISLYEAYSEYQYGIFSDSQG